MNDVNSTSVGTPNPTEQQLQQPKTIKHKRQRQQQQQLSSPQSPGSGTNLSASVTSHPSPPPPIDDTHTRRTSHTDDDVPPINTTTTTHTRVSHTGVPRRPKQRVTYDPTIDAGIGHSDAHTGGHPKSGTLHDEDDAHDDERRLGQPLPVFSKKSPSTVSPRSLVDSMNGGPPIGNPGPTSTAVIRNMSGGGEVSDRRTDGAVPTATSLSSSRGGGQQQPNDEFVGDFLEKLRESMNRRGIVNEPGTAAPNRYPGSQLTLDEIRRGLGAFGKHGGAPEVHHSPSKGGGRPSSGENLTVSDQEDDVDEFEPLDAAELELCKARMQALSQLCEEVLVYCSLLDSSRLRAVEEGTRLQKSLRQLEALLDSAPQREMQLLNQVERLRQMHTKLDQRYRALKTKAKQLIRECQESRDRLEAEYQKSNANLQSLESELFSLQTLVANQRKELERAREANLSLKSPRDVADLDLKLKALEKDNDELRFQKSQVEEEYDKLTQALASQVQSSNLSQLVSPSSDSVKLKGEIGLLEATLNSNLEEIRAQNVEHSKKLSSIRQDMDNYASYGKKLLKMVDTVSGNKEN
eukprot:Lankesteria_metandrocarpae@DN4885_c0_g1_i1.p1